MQQRRAPWIRLPGMLCALLAVVWGVHADAAVTYILDDLGALGTWTNYTAAINDSGRTVGFVQDAQFMLYGYRTQNFAVGAVPYVSVNDLVGSLGGGWSQANAVNAIGQTVGASGNAFGQSRAFRVPANRALISADSLGTLGGGSSVGLGINDLGQAVGGAETIGGAFHAFRTQPNQAINPASDDLGTLGGDWSQAHAINNAGQVVGGATTASGLVRAFATSANAAIQPQDAVPLPAGMTRNIAYAVNQAGLIAGSAWNDQGQYRAFRATRAGNLWSVLDLGALGGSVSEALGVNDLGAVVGYATGSDDQTRAFVCHDSTMTDLNLLINPLAGWTLTRAVDINNQGQIIGQGLYLGQERAFLLTPFLTEGDFNGDGLANVQDINPFILALRDLSAYRAAYPDVILSRIDPNGDGLINVQDINPFIALLTNPSGIMMSLPEPTSLGWWLGAGLLTGLRRRRRRQNTDAPPWFEALEPRRLMSGEASAISATPLDVTPGPRVTALWISGTHWSSSFLNAVSGGTPGSPGYPLPVGSAEQLRAVPWLGVDRISVRFDQAVDVDALDLSLRGVNQPQVEVVDFAYDASTFTAAWTLAAPLGPDVVVVELNGQGDDPIVSLAGHWLDGEWLNPLDGQTGSTFPSGDGAQGGNFQFLLSILPGDVSRNGAVASDDLLAIPSGVVPLGSPRYLTAADVNADGQIRPDDLSLARARLGHRLPEGLPVYGPTINHQVSFDGAASGDLTVDFDRDSQTVDPTGQPVASDEIRYDTDRAVTDLNDFELAQKTAGTVFPIASGVDLDGQTPLTIYADSNYTIKVILGSIDALPDLMHSVLNTARPVWAGDLMKTGRPGPGDPNVVYTPKAFVVLHGSFLAMCVRRVWDAAAGNWMTDGTALLYSLNRGALWNIAGQYDCVPGQYGREMGNIWCFNTYYPDTDSTDAPLEVWLPYTDYNANSGSPGGQLFLAKAHRASVDGQNNNWVIDAPVKLLQELQTNMHYHAAGVIPGSTTLRLFLAKGDNLGRQEVVELYCPDKSQWADTALWQVFHAVNGQTDTPQAYGNQFVAPVPGPEFGTLLVTNDVSNQEISLLRPGANPGDPVTFQSVFGEQASSDYALGTGHERKYEGLWLTLPKPETRTNYVGNSVLHYATDARRILYSADGVGFAYVGAYLRGTGPTTGITLHGDKILLTPSLNDRPYLRALDVPTAQTAVNPALVAPGAVNALNATPWQVVTQPAAGNQMIPLQKNAQGLWLDPDTALPLEVQPPSLGPVFLLVINSTTSGNLGAYRWLGSQTVGYDQFLIARIHTLAVGSRLPRVVFSTLGGDLTIAANPIDTDGWAAATMAGAGSLKSTNLSISSSITPGVRMYVAFDTVQIVNYAVVDGQAYPVQSSQSAPDEHLTIQNLALTTQPWSVEADLLLPPGYYDSQSAGVFVSSPLMTLYQDAQHHAELWADYADNTLKVRLTSGGYSIELRPQRVLNINTAALEIDTSGQEWRLHSPTGEFAGYRWASGDVVYVSQGAGCRPGWYEVAYASGNYNIYLAASPGLVPCNNALITTVKSGYFDFRYLDQVQLDVSRQNPQTFVVEAKVSNWSGRAELDHLAVRSFTPTEVRFANADFSRIAAVGVVRVAAHANDYFGSPPFTPSAASMTAMVMSLIATPSIESSLSLDAGNAPLIDVAPVAPSPAPLSDLEFDFVHALPGDMDGAWTDLSDAATRAPELSALAPIDHRLDDLPIRPADGSLAAALTSEAQPDPAGDSDAASWDQPWLSIFDLVPALTV